RFRRGRSPQCTLFPYTTLFRSEEQFAVSRPIGARDDNGLCGCAFANGRSQFGLYALPAIAVVEFRLVQNLKEHKIRTPRRVVLRSEEHTSELQSPYDHVCRPLL